MGPGAVQEAFNAAPGLLEKTGEEDEPAWRRAVTSCRALQGDFGPGLAVTVRLDIKKGPKIWEIGEGLLKGLGLDSRLVRFERTAMWVVRGAGAVDPFEALDERPWKTAAGMEGYRV
jgi:hypothetical protein